MDFYFLILGFFDVRICGCVDFWGGRLVDDGLSSGAEDGEDSYFLIWVGRMGEGADFLMGGLVDFLGRTVG